MVKKHFVSVVIPTYNNEKLIKKCVNSILNQTYTDFELIIIDDGSTDNSIKVLKGFKDKRLKILVNKTNKGSAHSRNKGISVATGKYIFFIDGDCIASKNWIEQGIKTFNENGCVGVEGAVYYVSKQYKPTAYDDIGQNLEGQQYMTGNIAYTKKILEKVGGFNAKLKRMQDRDLGLRIIKIGEIIFNKKMEVRHQKFYMTFKKKIKTFGECAKAKVYLFKQYDDNEEIYCRIYRPLNLLTIICPLFLFGVFFLHKYKTLKDYKTILYIYPSLIVERFMLWKTAINEKVFLV
ncbi:glycosyltransferase family 2 protein [Patescibacteria group bacterium]|nr:glycosyltransferase family 2 protein [Patescibacteria group bacterium]